MTNVVSLGSEDVEDITNCESIVKSRLESIVDTDNLIISRLDSILQHIHTTEFPCDRDISGNRLPKYELLE